MIKIQSKIKKYDQKISNFIGGFYFLYACNQVVASFAELASFYSIWRVLYQVSLMALLLQSFEAILHRVGLLFAVIEFAFLSMYLISFWGYGNVEVSLWKSVTFTSLSLYVPLGVGAYCILDRKTLFETLYKMARLTQFLLVMSLLLVGSNAKETYSMASGYALLLQMTIIFGHWIITKKKLDIIITICDFVMIFLFGSRGPILCFGIFLLLNLLFSRKIPFKNKLLYILCMGVVCLCMTLLYKEILNILVFIIDRFGFSSRTLRLMLQGIATYDSGRDVLLEGYINSIQQKPWLGWGAVGGRNYGVYPHNLYIELLLCFGIPLGVLISLIITAILLKGVFQKEIYQQMLAFVYISRIIGLLLSGSIFQSSDFMICIAMCLSGRLYVGNYARNIGQLTFYRSINQYIE